MDGEAGWWTTSGNIGLPPLAGVMGVGRQQQQPTPGLCLVQPIGAQGGEVMYFWCICFRGELGFLNCDDICMCVVNKQFELLKFVFDSMYVDLQYDEISLTFIVWSCEVSVLRECEGARVTAMLVWEPGCCVWGVGIWVVHVL